MNNSQKRKITFVQNTQAPEWLPVESFCFFFIPLCTSGMRLIGICTYNTLVSTLFASTWKKEDSNVDNNVEKCTGTSILSKCSHVSISQNLLKMLKLMYTGVEKR